METYDLKPEAPAEYRGDFKPISTNVPGLQVCEHLPRHARIADRFTLIRSVAHNFADHGGGHTHYLTGRDPKQPTGFVNDYPMVGSMTAKVREDRNVGLPNYISGTDAGRQGVDVFSFGAAYLGASYTPFTVVGDPDSPKFEIKDLVMNATLASQRDDRERLLHGFDAMRRDMDRSGVMEAMDVYDRKAMDLMTAQGPARFRPVSRTRCPARPLRPASVGPTSLAGAAASGGRQHLGDDGPRESDAAQWDHAEVFLLQLGFSCGQLPHIRRRSLSAADLRPGNNGTR